MHASLEPHAIAPLDSDARWPRRPYSQAILTRGSKLACGERFWSRLYWIKGDSLYIESVRPAPLCRLWSRMHFSELRFGTWWYFHDLPAELSELLAIRTIAFYFLLHPYKGSILRTIVFFGNFIFFFNITCCPPASRFYFNSEWTLPSRILYRFYHLYCRLLEGIKSELLFYYPLSSAFLR